MIQMHARAGEREDTRKRTGQRWQHRSQRERWCSEEEPPAKLRKCLRPTISSQGHQVVRVGYGVEVGCDHGRAEEIVRLYNNCTMSYARSASTRYNSPKVALCKTSDEHTATLRLHMRLCGWLLLSSRVSFQEMW